MLSMGKRNGPTEVRRVTLGILLALGTLGVTGLSADERSTVKVKLGRGLANACARARDEIARRYGNGVEVVLHQETPKRRKAKRIVDPGPLSLKEKPDDPRHPIHPTRYGPGEFVTSFL